MKKSLRVKILYLVTGLHTGGAEIVLWRLLRGLNKENYDIVVVSIVPLGNVGRKMKDEGFRVLSLRMRSKVNPFIFLKLLCIVREEKPDILHSFLFHANFLGRVVGRMCKVPVIISSIRNEYFGGVIRKKLIRWTDRLCNITVIVSNNRAERALRNSVIMRKITFGNRSTAGIRNHQVVMSILQTALLHGIEPLPIFLSLATNKEDSLTAFQEEFSSSFNKEPKRIRAS